MDKLNHIFKIGDIVKASGKEGTNGKLVKDELYEVVGLTKENNTKDFKQFGYARKPIIVLANGVETKPFLGKLEIA